jgi:MFS transporter, CP family, cyanate transporter
VPTAAASLWPALVGIGAGAISPPMLALALDHVEDPRDSADLSEWMLAIGFSIAAAGPVFIGGLRDLADRFEPGVGALAVLAATAALVAVTVPWPRPATVGIAL